MRCALVPYATLSRRGRNNKLVTRHPNNNKTPEVKVNNFNKELNSCVYHVPLFVCLRGWSQWWVAEHWWRWTTAWTTVRHACHLRSGPLWQPGCEHGARRVERVQSNSVFAPSSRAKLVGKLVLPPTPAVLGASPSTDLVLIKPPNELESVRSN